MENLTGKKALIILTNESFMPKSGRGGRRLLSDGLYIKENPQGAILQGSPAAWIPSQPTILDPPTSYASISNTEDDFAQGHQKTGVDIFELGYIWMTLYRKMHMELTFATPRGGPVAADPLSMERIEKDSKLRDTLREERDLVMRMGHTIPISWVKPTEFDLVVFLGGHGAMFDLPEHDDVACAVAEIYRKGGVVAAIGHGVAGLLNVKTERRSGEYLIKGKRITCFTKEEERKTGYGKFLPYILEDRVRERGAKLDIKSPFETNVVMDERIVTAQNAPSIHEFVTKVTEQLRHK